jgi:predicted nuclease with RNAse H fold
MKTGTQVVVGIDLAGSDKRNTGFCLMDSSMSCRTEVLHTDDEILGHTLAAKPSVVSIDAPLFLPKGRKSIEDRGPPHFRECDKELLRMHIRFFPISLGPMRMLTTRGMKLRAALEGRGLEVIESFPGAIQDLLQMPRKQAGLPLLARALTDYGIALGRPEGELNGDELDAVTSALVGLLYMTGKYRAIGDPTEGLMILPALQTI